MRDLAWLLGGLLICGCGTIGKPASPSAGFREARRLAVGGSVASLAFSPDGKLLAAGTREKTVTLWDVGSGARRTVLSSPSTSCQAAFSPDGSSVAAACFSFEVREAGAYWTDGNIACWETASGAQRWAERTGMVVALAFAPDGQTIASLEAKRKQVSIRHAATGKQLQTFPAAESGYPSLAFAPDGRSLASASCDRVEVWAVPEFEKRVSIATCANAVAYSPDGKLLATAAGEPEGHAVMLWNPVGGQPVQALRAHRSQVLALSFAPDGRLASAGRDGKVHVWDARAMRLLDTLPLAGALFAVAFSPDGRLLAAGSTDGTVAIWERR